MTANRLVRRLDADEETEGLTRPGWNERVFTFYTPESAAALHGALERFGGGRIVVNLLDTRRVELVYVTPLDGAFTKPVASRELGNLLADKEIDLVTEFNGGEIDGAGGRLAAHDGREVDFDLLVTVLLHGGAAYVERSPGLGDVLGFVPTTDTRSRPRPRRTSSLSATRPTCRRLNHLGTLLFQSVYWHVLLPGRELPALGPAMPTAGKRLSHST
jgi:hypothetical protein